MKFPNKKISTVRARGFGKGAISYLSSPVGISFMEQFQNGIPLVQEKVIVFWHQIVLFNCII